MLPEMKVKTISDSYLSMCEQALQEILGPHNLHHTRNELFVAVHNISFRKFRKMRVCRRQCLYDLHMIVLRHI